jgi:putative SOS response-associated peptidase YedK
MFVRSRSGRPFGFAGLYDVWRPPEGEPVTSCTIVTTQSSPLVQPIHNRMPLILPRPEQADWLDPITPDIDAWLATLPPYPDQELQIYEVSRRVNSPQNNSAECVQPVGAA